MNKEHLQELIDYFSKRGRKEMTQEHLQELIEALKLIQDECEKSKCEDCIFSKGGICLIRDDCPSDWFVYDEPRTVTAIME